MAERQRCGTIEYGVAPYVPTGTPTVSGVTNPYNYSGLTANTTYEFYVRADCGGANGTSALGWSL